MDLQRFHLSLPCLDVNETKAFYVDELGFELGRSSFNWLDVNFFGHQITFALDKKTQVNSSTYSLESKILPVFHVGIILDPQNWNSFWEKLKEKSYLELEPTAFLSGNIGEHTSFFIKDPNGYSLEFKRFNDPNQIFQK